MEKNSSFENKVFPIKFGKIIFTLSIASLLLCVVGIVLSIYNIVTFGIVNVGDALKYPFLIVICCVAIVFVVSILTKSQYVITKDRLLIEYGFLKSEYPLSEITALTLDRDKNKLIAYMGEAYMLITVDPIENERFAREMLAVNGDIDFSYTITENKPPENENN